MRVSPTGATKLTQEGASAGAGRKECQLFRGPTATRNWGFLGLGLAAIAGIVGLSLFLQGQ
jgi:hypothetical protein